MKSFAKVFLACLIASFLGTGALFAQLSATDPTTGLQWCHLLGYAAPPFGPSLGVIIGMTDPVGGGAAVIAPGVWVRATGLGFAFGDAAQVAAADTAKPLPTTLSGTQVLVDGHPAKILYFGIDGQAIPFPSVMEFQPTATAGKATAVVQLQMTEPDGSGQCITPGILQTATVTTPGQTAIIAVRYRGFITIHYTGMGARNLETAQAFVDGQSALITYSDQNEITFRIPSGSSATSFRIWTASHGELAFEMPLDGAASVATVVGVAVKR